jgi:tRNA-splicing ligase RtcB
MKARELENLGVPRGSAMQAALRALGAGAAAGLNQQALRAAITRVVGDPAGSKGDRVFGELAAALAKSRLGAPTYPGQGRLGAPTYPGQGRPGAPTYAPRSEPAPWRQWGADLEAESVNQMARACELPVAVAGALMPDAHVGYGLPIGGVLATRSAVIPYAVGVDIACRMKLSILDLPASWLEKPQERERLTRALERETRFGIGCSFQKAQDHAAMDLDWTVSPVTTRLKDKARSQLGTSGSGNHFVEFGTLTVSAAEEAGGPAAERAGATLGLAPGVYLALLSHSGSRGTGATVCDFYSRIAMDQHPDLPKELRHLAWLDLNASSGQEYWAAMELMGEYASANHAVIHRNILKNLGARAIAGVENHHNFAWKETHVVGGAGDGSGGSAEEVIVHRKGATPAGEGVLGVIPGSMATPGFVVRGRGSAPSLRSASHGAGRLMSRTAARQRFAWGNVKRELADRGVTLLSAGIDEVPGVYKDIHTVMAQQQDLVEVLARFDPKLVKMAPEGERPED